MSVDPVPLSIAAIGQIAIPVVELSRAERFYRDVLGLKLLFEDKARMAFFDVGGVRLLLDASPPAGGRPRACSIVYFRVADIDVAHARLAAHETTLLGVPHRAARLPSHELWLAFFNDGEGNTMALMEERPHAG